MIPSEISLSGFILSDPQVHKVGPAHTVHHNLEVVQLGLGKNRHKYHNHQHELVALTLVNFWHSHSSHKSPSKGVFFDLMIEEKNGSLFHGRYMGACKNGMLYITVFSLMDGCERQKRGEFLLVRRAL